MAERTVLEHDVVPMRLDARDNAGDARLVERLIAKMATNGWTFVSLAAPTAQTALVVFSRPMRKGGE